MSNAVSARSIISTTSKFSSTRGISHDNNKKAAKNLAERAFNKIVTQQVSTADNTNINNRYDKNNSQSPTKKL
jgi:hypothetical protein